MSVLQIRGRTTTSAQDFSEFSLSSNSQIYTTAAPENIEEFSIEVTLGDGWNDNYSETNKNLRKISDSITVRANDSIVVEVTEDIRIPHNRYGIVLPTGSLFLSQGILIASAKVEPAFSGKLKLRLFNTTDRKICLKKGTKLGSIIFFPTESTTTHDIIHRSSEISEIPLLKRTLVLKWFGSNKTTWIGWIVTALVPWSVTLFLFINYYKPTLEKPQATTIEQAEPAPEISQHHSSQK